MSRRSVRIDVRGRKMHHAVSIRATAVMVGIAACLAMGTQSTRAGATAAKERVNDCTTDSMLSGVHRDVVRYVVWCGVQSGRVTLKIRRPNGPALLGFSRTADASGT